MTSENDWGLLVVGGTPAPCAKGAAACADLDHPARRSQPEHVGLLGVEAADVLRTIRHRQGEGHPVGVLLFDARESGQEELGELVRCALASDPSLFVVTWGGDDRPWTPASKHARRLVHVGADTPARTLDALLLALARASEESRRLRARNAELDARLRQNDPGGSTESAALSGDSGHASTYDLMTGLPNRGILLAQIARRQERLRADEGAPRFAVLYIDLDNFKAVNDSLGHERGDELLRAVAQRLVGSVRSLDAVTRAGNESAVRLRGDEFVVLLEEIRRPSDAGLVADRIVRALSQPVRIAGYEVVPGASVGVMICESGQETPQQVLEHAELALYRAKEAGKGGYAFYDPNLHAEGRERLRMENALRRALERGEFEIVYEPIISVRTGRLRGFEALTRWTPPGEEAVSPSTFIPIAEELGLIVPLGEWALREVCRAVASWSRAHALDDDFSVSVNVSRCQLVEPAFMARVRAAIQASGIQGGRLCFEVTESAVMADMETARDVLTRVKALGVAIHMDDFGTGLSSLSCLHELPLDVLKIDRSFILNMRDDRNYAAVVQAILTMASHLGFEVVAEGVESGDQLASLISLDCDFVQGFHFSRALTREQALAAIREPERLIRAA
ncbi:MAG: bifunctional diguanylate cyclase/phosphodiesterase [Phycisphaerales bacterium]